MLLVSCSSSPSIDDLLDGNIIVGDSSAADAREYPDARRDAEARDVSLAGDRGGGTDAGEADAMEDPCRAAPAERIDVAAAVSRAAELDDVLVSVTGTATTSLICTTTDCPANDPCCNACTGSVLIDGRVELLASTCFVNVGCGGNECQVAVCRPPLLDVEETFTGVLRNRQPRVGLELFRISPR